MPVWRVLCCGLIAQCVFTSCLDPLTAAYVVTNPPPAEKNLHLLTDGTPRARIHQEFGHPAGTYTDTKTGRLHDVFRFRQGYSRGARWAILPTIGVGYATKGTSMAINVEYDEHERVIRYRPVQ